MTAWMSLGEVTSQVSASTLLTVLARPGGRSLSLPAVSMSAKTTFAPSAAKATAVARPMPLPAPVTNATFPANLD